MTKDSEAIRKQADARFGKQEEGRTTATMVMVDIRAAKEAEQAKTARLRELRLAKEATDRNAAASRLLTSSASKKQGSARAKSAGPRSNRGSAR